MQHLSLIQHRLGGLLKVENLVCKVVEFVRLKLGIGLNSVPEVKKKAYIF
tara:strand:+ start:145 stop:294 length:150 start_codon:yes stop_codon:yes gene_type:complete